MKTQRINNSATVARYRVDFESFTEQDMTAEQIADLVEPYNFGARWETVGPNSAVLSVYID